MNGTMLFTLIIHDLYCMKDLPLRQFRYFLKIVLWTWPMKSIRFVYFTIWRKIKQKEVRFIEAICESDSFAKNHDNIIGTEETNFKKPFWRKILESRFDEKLTLNIIFAWCFRREAFMNRQLAKLSKKVSGAYF